MKKQKSFDNGSATAHRVKKYSKEEIERKRLEAKYRRDHRQIERKRLEAHRRLIERLKRSYTPANER